ncbi:hypothetical protein [Nitrosopumilus adriaticus]|uniref:Uncharacterized protein n=1 Tax=Nitrosopumilus adriaticus TaxID=1580092 RepID=A0A0D5C2K3_9ARCH|nr:hypothetical protein [Nitrosopumilus adriaticus]AJW71029.1 membrane protein of unknown function [Nitrosopumilus adriaticus]
MIVITVVVNAHQHIPTETPEEKKEINSFFTAAMISLLSGTLILLKKGLNEKYVTDSFQILLLMITPFSAFIPILGKVETFWIILPVYYAVITSWFLFVDDLVIGNTEREEDGNRKRNVEQNYAFKTNLRVYMILMGLSVAIFYWYFLLIVPQANNVTN